MSKNTRKTNQISCLVMKLISEKVPNPKRKKNIKIIKICAYYDLRIICIMIFHSMPLKCNSHYGDHSIILIKLMLV